jgi:mRNA-degrading endonuclease RelE of RelBE toxin-antitoxin system
MSDWKVFIPDRIERRLAKLPPRETAIIKAKVNELAKGLSRGKIKKLKGRPEWSKRIGGRRVLIGVDFENKTLVVIAVGTRGDIYKK